MSDKNTFETGFIQIQKSNRHLLILDRSEQSYTNSNKDGKQKKAVPNVQDSLLKNAY